MISTSIVGASGYVGCELVERVLAHPELELAAIYSSTLAGKKLADVYPQFQGVTKAEFVSAELIASDTSNVMFLSMPNGEAQRIVPSLNGKKIIDLSGDFRLRDIKKYSEYYEQEHTAHELLASSHYGLPELFSFPGNGCSLVANPGCYATGVTLALAPLAKVGLLPEHISVVGLSGVSGAGRKATQAVHFVEVNENIRAYKLGNHQHTPEIEQVLSAVAGKPQQITFAAHLIPITRGIHITTTVPLVGSLDKIKKLYEEFYYEQPFIRLRWDEPVEIKHVAHTNFCDIHLAADNHTNTLIITAVIDNLGKGAAWQAIQNLNILFDLPETTGLLS